MSINGMQVKLSWVDVQKGEIRQPLLHTPIAFGRTLASMPEEIDGQRVSRMVLADAQVDPYHTLLEVHDGQLRINDRGSRSGSPVNDVTLPYQPVNQGDRIQIGPYTIHITAIIPASAPSASSSPPSSVPPSPPPPPPPFPQSPSVSAENLASTEAVGFPSSTQPTAPTESASFASPPSPPPPASSLNQATSNPNQTSTSGQFGLDGTCNRQVGFLFKRRCGRTSTVGCTHCQNGRVQDDPFFYDYDTYYPGYGRYNRGYWGHSYYRNRDRYYYDYNRRSTDFTEADGESFEQEGDQDYEMDLDAS